MICKKCGFENDQDAKFCSECGGAIASNTTNEIATNDLMTTELKNTKSTVESASAEKTLEYETDQGTIKEKTTVNYKTDKGNIIDNAVNTITESKSVQKAASFFNKVIRLGAAGFGGLFAAAGSYALSKEMFSHYVYKEGRYFGERVWDVQESTVIFGSVVVGLIVAPIIFSLYTKWFIRH